MSHPIPTYDPTEETVKLVAVCECVLEDDDEEEIEIEEELEPLDDCLDCNGTGFITIYAHQRGGEIVDEAEKLCQCRLD